MVRTSFHPHCSLRRTQHSTALQHSKHNTASTTQHHCPNTTALNCAKTHQLAPQSRLPDVPGKTCNSCGGGRQHLPQCLHHQGHSVEGQRRQLNTQLHTVTHSYTHNYTHSYTHNDIIDVHTHPIIIFIIITNKIISTQYHEVWYKACK
jgi:hypothetical protein